jgi:ribonucleoside-diphosphate reductase alpha chain
MTGPKTPHAQQLHAEKYRQEGESFREAMNRIAAVLTDEGPSFKPFRDVLLDMRFLPAGRVQAAVGAARRTTAFNCFVSGTIEDSFVDGSGSIMARATEAATTMRMGGGIGYDWSTLRPNGAVIKKLQSKSGGPLSFMPIFDGIGRATSSAGHRRGAQMGVLRVDHPDVVEFIRAKQNHDKLTGFNVSVAITDDFMNALARGSTYDLRFGGQVYGEADAHHVWEMLMRSTWDWAEPGVLFIDTINRKNNLHYCETIAATNPCGEQPLPPFGACLLGSFNLVRYVSVVDSVVFGFDYDQLRRDVRHVVRAMDRVTDVSFYPLQEQEQEAHSKRRMGLGVTGLSNALEALGAPYGSREFIQGQARIMDLIRDESYAASVELARERGSFPLFDAEKFCASEFVKTLPQELQADIRKHGIRNSHLTSIAPTGTISMAADNVSSGIEPVFALKTDRTVNMADGARQIIVQDYGLANFGVEGKTCDRVTVQEHLDVLITAALRVDSAVSKTCNVPPSTAWADFKGIYSQAYERGAKGCTTYQIGCKRGAVLRAVEPETETGAACTYDAATGTRSCE